MKVRLRILIDNTFPPRLARELREQSNHADWQVQHLTEIAKAETRDQHWIAGLEEIGTEGEWLVITRDEGHGDRRAADKLPLICKSHGIAYLIVTASLGNKAADLKEALTRVWDELPQVVVAADRLRRYPHNSVKLGRVSLKGGATGYRISVGQQSLSAFLGK